MLRSWREVRDARHKGRRDGRAGVPAVDQDALPFSLREIIARADGRLHGSILRWTNDKRAVEGELTELTQVTASAEARLADAEIRHDAAVRRPAARAQDRKALPSRARRRAARAAHRRLLPVPRQQKGMKP